MQCIILLHTQDREHTTSTRKQITVITVGPHCMKCNDVLTVGSGHGRGLVQWLQSNLGDEYSVTSVLTLSVELCNVVRKFVVLSKKGTPNNKGVGVQISELKKH